MAFITWNAMFSTGFSEQDNQHKKLIELINQLNDAKQAGKSAEMLGSVLFELVDYTVFHFGYEEKLMAEYKYADTPAHKAEHAKFIQTVGDLKKKFDSGDVVITSDIMKFLCDWLIDHILRADKKLGQELTKLGVM